MHYPTILSAGPFPVLLFLHGRHSTCFQTSNPSNTELDWPCGGGFESITSYEGYDYLAEQMASHGYIVISISANGINANDNSIADYGMQARAELIQYHLDLWNTFNTIGGAPFGDLFIGKLDMANIGTMGHSRGGEGVVKNALLNESLGSPYGIKAVLSLAPVDFLRSVLNNVAFMNVAPYCDGDVSDLQGVHFYDDARYLVTDDEAPKHSVLLLGANHNFFNTVWTPGSYIAGTSDDWDDVYGSNVSFCGTDAANSGRLSPTNQQAAFNAYASAFFRVYIGKELIFAPLLEVSTITPPASSMLDSTQIFVSYQAPHSLRLDVNKTDSEDAEDINALLGTVSENGLDNYDICGDNLSEINCNVSSFQNKEPHSGSDGELGMSQLGIKWDDTTDWFLNELPEAYRNLSSYRYLQFRAAVNFDEANEDEVIDFSLQLIDTSNNVSSQWVSYYTNALYFPPGSNFYVLPKVLYNTIKIPLLDFEGVDLTQIKQIKFLFNGLNSSSIFITDLAVSGGAKQFDTTDEIFLSDVNIEDDFYFDVFPNPASTVLNIKLGNANKHIVSVSIIDILGKEVYSTNDIKSMLLKVDIEHLAIGMYFINIKTINQRYAMPFIKQ